MLPAFGPCSFPRAVPFYLGHLFFSECTAFMTMVSFSRMSLPLSRSFLVAAVVTNKATFLTLSEILLSSKPQRVDTREDGVPTADPLSWDFHFMNSYVPVVGDTRRIIAPVRETQPPVPCLTNLGCLALHRCTPVYRRDDLRSLSPLP